MSPSVSVKVAVRMRPFNKNEEAEDAKAIIDMSLAHKQITIKNPSNPEDSKSFTYDFLYNSLLPVDDPDYASQDTVWNDLGNEVRLLEEPSYSSLAIRTDIQAPLYRTCPPPASRGSLGGLQLLAFCLRSDW